MLFKKNPQPNTTTASAAAQPLTEEQELAALESQLDFLRKPSPGPKLKTPEMIAKEKEEAMAKAQEIHVVPGNAIPMPQSVRSLDDMYVSENEPRSDGTSKENGTKLQAQPDPSVLPAGTGEQVQGQNIQTVLPAGTGEQVQGQHEQTILPDGGVAPSNPMVRQGNVMPNTPAKPANTPEKTNIENAPMTKNAPVPSRVQIPQPQGTLPTVPPQNGIQPNPFLQQPQQAPVMPQSTPAQQVAKPPVPQAYAIQNTSVNPVAPAVMPPQAIVNPTAAPQTQKRENAAAPTENVQEQVLTPRPLQEAAAESAAAQLGKTVQPDPIPTTQNGWGRQVNYKTAVVKPGGQSNSIVSSGHQEARPAPKQIKNPLPTPKKHVSKEMEFDLQPNSTMMHFDLVDMKGIDHFDIE